MVLHYLVRTRNRLRTPTELEQFRRGFDVSTMIGDKTVELSGLTNNNYSAGARVLEPLADVKLQKVLLSLATTDSQWWMARTSWSG